MADIVIPKQTEFRIRQEADRVLIIVDGRCVADLDYKAAQTLERAVRAKRLRAEEYAKAEQISKDSAILLRAGARMVLSDRADIKQEAVKLAAHDRDLRRFMPSIRSQESFGHPVFETHPPKKEPAP